jgi:hypothetical protein
MTDQRSLQDGAAFRGRIKASVFGAIIVAGLVATGLAAFDATQTHQAVTHHTEASDAIAPTTKVGRSGAMMVYEPVW